MKYFLKMLKTLILISVFYISIFSVVVGIIFTNYIKIDTKRNAEVFINQVSQEADAQLISVQELFVMLKQNENFIKYANDQEVDPFNKLTVFKFLSLASINFSDSRYMVALIHNSDNNVITNNATIDKSIYLERIGMNSDELIEINNYFQNNTNVNTIYRITSHNQGNEKRNLVNIIKHDSYSFSQPFLLIATYDQSKFLNIDDFNEGTLAMYLGNEMIFCNGKVPEGIVEKVVSKNSKDYIGYNVNSTETFSEQNVNYWYIYPKNITAKKLYNILFVFISICLILLTFSIIIMTLIAKFTYAPLNNVMKSINIQSLSKEDDELKLISNRFSELSRANNRLSVIIEEHRKSDNDVFTKKLLYGTIDNNSAEQYFKANNLNPDKNYIVIIVKYLEYSDLEKRFNIETIVKLKQTIREMFQQYFSKANFVRIIDDSSNTFDIITTVNDINVLKRELLKLLLTIEKTSEIEMVASLGTVTDLYKISASYAVAAHILQNLIYQGQSKKIYTEETIIGADTLYYPPEVENSLIACITSGKSDETHIMLSEIFDKNLHNNILLKEKLTCFAFAVVTTVNKILTSYKLHTEDIFHDNLNIYLEIKMCKTVTDIEQRTTELFKMLLAYFCEKRQKNESDLANSMITYIEENYTSDISRLDLAEYLNLSQSYTSTLFKMRTGITFKDYLANYRYEIAKQKILEYPNIKMNDLAKSIGLNDKKALSRVILKHGYNTYPEFVKSVLSEQITNHVRQPQ